MAYRLQVLSNHFGTSAEDDSNEQSVAMSPTSAALGTTPEFSQAQNMTVFPPAKHDLLHFDELLTPEERRTRATVRSFMETEVAPIIAGYWERAAFPFELVPKLAKLNLGGATLQGYGCAGQSIMSAALTVVEMARVDASMSTFLLVHNSLCMLTIGLLGSESQKQQLLPSLASLKQIGAWGLTEPSNGSDASALMTTAERVPGGWKLNGRKRWIGNATFADIVVIWARNLDTKQVNAFVVKKGTPGFTTSKIEGKISLRVVQNADIHMSNVLVPDSARLTGVTSFADTNKVLAVSRIMVAWQPVGIAMGAYDMTVRYLEQRKQFGAPLSSFQLSQDKLARMLGSIQAMALMCWRLSKLAEAGNMSHAMASNVKAWTTTECREVLQLARELLGGNGILSHFLVAKSFCDLEAIHTYEGTETINRLVSGRDITGIAAFRAPPNRRAKQETSEGRV